MFKLTKSKSKALSGICADIAQICFGLFVGAIVLPLDAAKLLVILFDLGLSIGFWYLSLIFADKGKM